MAGITVYLDNTQLSNIKKDSGEKRLDPMSKNVISLACRLKELCKWQVTAILIAQEEDGIYLREALASGCDRAILAQPLQEGTDAGLAARGGRPAGGKAARQAGMDAYLAAALAAQAGGEIILMGDRALDGGTSYLGGQVSELLQIPHVSGVADMIRVDGHQVEVRRTGDGTQEEAAVDFPCLLTVGEKEQKAAPLLVDKILQAFGMELRFVPQEEGERLTRGFLRRDTLEGMGSLQVLGRIAVEGDCAGEIINCIPVLDEAGQVSPYEDAVKVLQQRWKERGMLP